MQKYQVQGFPTLKIFGADKKKPIDYQGERKADAIVNEAMKALSQMVKDRKGSKGGGKSSSSSSSSDSSSKKSSGGRKSDVVELTENNFNELVMQSNDQWLVEFFAPWCGHCKQVIIIVLSILYLILISFYYN
jgi:protein disulfide-isomerase A6